MLFDGDEETDGITLHEGQTRPPETVVERERDRAEYYHRQS